MRRVALVVALAGCDKLLDLQRIPDAPSQVVCRLEKPAPFLCADFDDDPTTYYVEGAATVMPTPAATVMPVARAPGHSQPNALWIDSTLGGTYFLDQRGTDQITNAHARFWLSIDSVPTNYAFELFDLGIENATTGCRIEVQIDAGSSLRMLPFCPGRMTAVPVFPALPSGFFPIDLDVDTTTGLETMTVEGTAVTYPLPAGLTSGGVIVRTGVLVANAPGPVLGYDDVVVTAR